MSRYLHTTASLVCLSVIGLSVVSYCGAKFVMDDALMFVRYAHNWTGTGTVSWNPGESPAYGATSLAFLSLVALVSALFHSSPYVICQVASCGSGILFLRATVFTVIREIEKSFRSFVLLVVTAGLAGGAMFLSAQFMTGMDTTLAMFTVSCLLLIWRGGEAVLGPYPVGILGGCALLVRPDLLLLSLGVPVIMTLAGSSDQKRFWRRVAGSTVVTIAALCAILTLYFGTPVPLSTYAKVFSPYGPDFKAVYRSMPYKQSINFMAAYWLLFATASGLLVLNAKDLFYRDHRLVLVLLLIVVSWFVYLLGVTQVMAYRGRFYHPVVLPCVIFLVVWGIKQTARNWGRWLCDAPSELDSRSLLSSWHPRSPKPFRC